MNKKALSTIERYSMLTAGDSVLAAVSGGADSMALLCFLLEIKDKYKLSVSVCHVNHLFRGDAAERDESFVREFCAQNSLDFHLLRCDVLSLSKERKIGFEECGRDVRYEFLNKTANELGGAKIATAHTLSDCGETLLFNIARGTSLSGISSISPVRGNIIRPLCECTREDIEKYLLKKNQRFMTDDTNFDTDYTRNFIRAQIIPAMKKINPSFESAVLSLTSLAREDAHFLNIESDKAYKRCVKSGKIDTKEFLSLNTSLSRRIIARLFTENNVMLSKKLCDSILESLKSGDFKINISKDTYFVKNGDFLYIEKTKTPQKKEEFEIPLSLGTHKVLGKRELEARLISREEFENIKQFSKNDLKNCIDYAIINNSFVLRTRKSGDKICLFPRNVTKTLKKLLNESKISKEKRDILLVLALENNVYWAEGLGVSAEAKITEETQSILFLNVSQKKKNDGEGK